MARTPAKFPEGSRITDLISLGVVAKLFPRETVARILEETGCQSQRQRKLPAHVVVYYVIALCLFMHVSYVEVLSVLLEGFTSFGWKMKTIRKMGTGGISQARRRLGAQPLRRLYREVVRPIAVKRTRGAWYRKKWKLVSLDGSTLRLQDTVENETEFGRPGTSRGKSSFPQLRLVSLVENGTHVLFGAQAGGCRQGEVALAYKVLPHLKPGMLCLADRGFLGYELWKSACSTKADQLWRAKKKAVLPCDKRLPDGSYLSCLYPSTKARRQGRDGIVVRVIEYRLSGVEDSQEIYRLVTTILDFEKAPARELAALYSERWEIETALGEMKIRLKEGKVVLRSKKPDLVLQEFYGLLMAHFAIRAIMHEAALEGDVDPDEISFISTVRVIRRKLPEFASFSPSGENSPA